ncbi:MAG: hypothetical protein E7311_07250 [Clostridiales bacterium]|nr:hypothetical protein [Clostridiales bacterium]
MEQNIKNKKRISIKYILGIIVIFILILVLYNILIEKYNKSFIEKYVAKIYSDYIIKDKSYEYLDDFWSTYYDIEEDDLSLEIICNTTLENKDTGMRITIPFYHSKYKNYTDTQYNRKNIKEMVEEYETYWNEINNVKSIYNIELQVSNVEITEADNCDIYAMAIYLKYEENIDMQQIINDINDIKTSLNIVNINYVVAKEEVYELLKPWYESNKYYIVQKDLKRIKENISNFDLYIDTYKKEFNNIEKNYSEYYIKNNNG